MKKLLRLLLCLFVSMGFYLATQAQTWKPIGPDENDQPDISDAFFNTIVIGPDGTPYIAYMDESIGAEVVVKKFNGSTWEVVGNKGLYGDYSSSLSLAVAPDGSLYVSFLASTGGTLPGLFVEKFNGSAWVDISPFHHIFGAYSKIAAGPDGSLYLSCSLSSVAGSSNAAVYKYSGNTWSSLTPAGGTISASNANCTDLCIATDGTLYIAYGDAAKTNKITVKKYSNNTWSSVGADGFTPSPVVELSLAIAPDGTPYVAYPDATSSNKLSVLKYDGSSLWVSVGAAGFTIGTATNEHIAISPDGTPMIIANDLDLGKKVIGKMFKNGNWTDIGSGLISTGHTDNIKLGDYFFNGFAISPTDGTPYAIYQDSILAYKTVVKKFANGKWVYVGQAATPDAVGDMNVKLDNNDVPYVVYTDVSDSYKAYVKKYVNGSWQTVGGSFSQGRTAINGVFCDIAFASDNTPYVVYTDLANNTNATFVKLFNGTSWVPVGTNGLVGIDSWFSRIFFSPDGIPYVGLAENSFSLSVKKYSGGTWVSVGNTHFAPAYSNPQLAFATDGTIYAACENSTFNGSSLVYTGQAFKLVNSTWQNMNLPYIPSTINLNFNLALAPDNTPYVSYADPSDNIAIVIKSFNGTSWNNVTQSSLSSAHSPCSNMIIGPDASINMVFDTAGIVSSNIYHVMNLKNGVWTTVGTGRPVAYYGWPVVLALPKTGGLITGYKSGQIFVNQTTVDVATPSLAPTVASFSPTIAGTGDTLIIKGTNFHTSASYSGVTKLSLGSLNISSYLVNSDKQITVIVGGGATGNVTVTTFNGTATMPGFTFIPTPVITYTRPLTFNSGDSVVLGTNPSTGYSYQWFFNNVAVAGATTSNYVAYKTGLYSVAITTQGVTRKSGYGAYVTVNFTPPAQPFTIAITGETCKGAANGSIAVSYNNFTNVVTYTATLTGNNITLTNSFSYTAAKFSNLLAGPYTLCITAASQPGFQQCQTIVIVEPKDLSLYNTIVSKDNSTVTLQLSGGSIYNIQLNGTLYSTKDSTVTLPVIPGSNHLIVTTDRACQGVIDRVLTISDNLKHYPDPFDKTLYLNIGDPHASKATVEIYSGQGIRVYKKQIIAQASTVVLDLSTITTPGVYILKLTVNNGMQRSFKIIKK